MSKKKYIHDESIKSQEEFSIQEVLSYSRSNFLW